MGKTAAVRSRTSWNSRQQEESFRSIPKYVLATEKEEVKN